MYHSFISMRRLIRLSMVAGLTTLLWIFSASAATETFHKAYAVQPGDSLEVYNRNGDVVIQRWDETGLDVYAEKRAKRAEELKHVKIEVTQGDRISIETVHLIENPQVSVFYRIQIPKDFAVSSVRSSNGNLYISQTRGDINAKTSNGEISMEQIMGDVRAKSSNAPIDIEKVEGYVAADTSNGSITIRDTQGIENLETFNGDIVAEIPALAQHDVTVKTSNGSIRLLLGSQLHADLEMKTSNGDIFYAQHPDIRVQEITKRRFRGRLGDGGDMLSGKTSNGSITLKPL